MVGQRADITVQDRVLYRPESVQTEVSALDGRLHPEGGIDYFAIARNLYPWDLFPDMIIGHPGYDNFLIQVASTQNMSVVDATQTLTALHQTDRDGVRAGHIRNSSYYNWDVISHLKPLRGCWRTKCTAYRTRWHSETIRTSHFISEQKQRRILVERRTITK